MELTPVFIILHLYLSNSGVVNIYMLLAPMSNVTVKVPKIWTGRIGKTEFYTTRNNYVSLLLLLVTGECNPIALRMAKTP